MKWRVLFTWTLCAVLSGSVLAQFRDNNPANPSNYIITQSYDGADDGGSFSRDTNGQVKFTPTHRDWGMPWVYPNQPLSGNSSGVSQTMIFYSVGTIHWHIQWNGIGGLATAPDKVIVKITSQATGGNAASVTLDNGLGSPTVALGAGFMAQGFQYRKVSLSGGVGDTEIHTSAVSTKTGVTGSAVAKADAASLVIADKAVVIYSDRDMTYHKEPVWLAPEANEVKNIEHVYGDTAIRFWEIDSEYGYLSGYDCRPTFHRSLWGDWTDPYNAWVASPEHWEDTGLSEIEWVTPNWQFTLAEAENMARNGPVSKDVVVTVVDQNNTGVSRTATYTMRIHAPQENITQGTRHLAGDPKKLFWGPNGGDGIVHVNQEISIGETHSRTIKVGLEGSGGGDIKLVEAVVKASVGAEWGQSATVSRSTSVSFDIPAGQKAYMVGGAQWIEWSVTWDAYGEHGYEGWRATTATKWVSGDKDTVERNLNGSDFVWEVKYGSTVPPEYL